MYTVLGFEFEQLGVIVIVDGKGACVGIHQSTNGIPHLRVKSRDVCFMEKEYEMVWMKPDGIEQ